MSLNTLNDILTKNNLLYHWSKYENTESILKKGILSINLLKKKQMPVYAPDIVQEMYGTDMISVISLIGEKNPHEIFLEKKLQCIYERPPEHRVWHIFRDDIIYVIEPTIKTIPLGWYPYEHLVKNVIDREDILLVCCNKVLIDKRFEEKSDLVIDEIYKICKKFQKKVITCDISPYL